MSTFVESVKEHAVAAYTVVAAKAQEGYNVLVSDTTSLFNGRCFKHFGEMNPEERSDVILKVVIAALLSLFLSPIATLLIAPLVFAHYTNPGEETALARVAHAFGLGNEAPISPRSVGSDTVVVDLKDIE